MLQNPTIQFAHPAYQMQAAFERRDLPGKTFQTWTLEETLSRLGEAEVLVLSGYWQNTFFDAAPNLAYVHVCAAGYDRYDISAFTERGIRLANSSGVNVNAVGDHAMALLLSLTRQLHLARDQQLRREWRGMVGDIGRREDELEGKTMLIYGLGAIGGRLARLAQAFGLRVLGIRRNTAKVPDGVEALHAPAAFLDLLGEADVVALTCPLTDETRGLVGAEALARMKPTAYVINVARGPVVDEQAMVAALEGGGIAGAGLDVFDPEPLPETSKLWSLENAIITPHSGGETRRYEENVIDILAENLARLSRGEKNLINQIA